MEFSPDNKVIQLCAKGMELEGQGEMAKASRLFLEAWTIAENNIEKFTAAHYIARHQKTIIDKLHWDETALQFALLVEGESIKEVLPSLYLNIGKCYEDLEDAKKAEKQYQTALSFVRFLPHTGYGKMIKTGIEKGLERVRISHNSHHKESN